MTVKQIFRVGLWYIRKDQHSNLDQSINPGSGFATSVLFNSQVLRFRQ
jgi:hypothetical protein